MSVAFFERTGHECPVRKDERDEVTRLRDAERARRLRALRGFRSRREVAEGARVTEKTVQRAEDPGPDGVLGMNAGKALAAYYGVSLDYLFAWSSDRGAAPRVASPSAARRTSSQKRSR